MFEFAPGALTTGIVGATRAGGFDIPFPASREARGVVILARDHSGAIRIHRCGGLPGREAVRRRNHVRLGLQGHFGYRRVLADINHVAHGRTTDTDRRRRDLLSELHATPEVREACADLPEFAWH